MINDVIKSLTTFALVVSLVFSSFFAIPPKKAEAFLGDSVSGTALLAKRIADGIAMAAAQAVIDRMVNSSIQWAQNGFEGNPAYVTDPKQFFGDIGDGVAGEFIAGSDLNFLCSPFQAQIRVALLKNYTEPQQFQCTLTEAIQNIEAFYSDFSQGGWDGWFSMTQNEANNPYGAYLTAKIEMDSRLASAIGLENQNLEWNQGFRSWAECVEKNPPMWIDVPAGEGTSGGRTLNPKHVPGKAVGECIKRGDTKTPGTIIKGQLDQVLPSGLEKLVNANHIEQIIAAFAGALLNRYVFGSKGLFNREKDPNAPPTTPPPPTSREIDIDGDGIVDGVDTSGDGQPDICYFGNATEEGSSSPPCKGSRGAGGDGGDGEEGQGIDIDGDGIADGFDSDSDGNINSCYFGGTPPNNCVGSKNNGAPPQSLRSAVEDERKKYPAGFITQAQAAAIMNAVAWNNRNLGWGLSEKTGGNRCPMPSGGASVACDILYHLPSKTIWDVFTSRSGTDFSTNNYEGRVTWSRVDVYDYDSRPWVAPVAP